MRKTPYWWATIDRAEKRGHFTECEIRRADNWPTCACSKQDKRIPRDDIGCPTDVLLGILGAAFVDYVCSDMFKDARRTLTKIEKRAAKVLAEELK